jgi:hypothetical protein
MVEAMGILPGVIVFVLAFAVAAVTEAAALVFGGGRVEIATL